MLRLLTFGDVLILCLSTSVAECVREEHKSEPASLEPALEPVGEECNLTYSGESSHGLLLSGDDPFCTRLMSLGDYMHERSEALFASLAIMDVVSYQGVLQKMVESHQGLAHNWFILSSNVISSVYAITLAIYNALKLFYRRCTGTIDTCSTLVTASYAIFGLIGLAFLFLPCLGGVIAAAVSAAAVHGVVPFLLSIVGPMTSRILENFCDFYETGEFDYKRLITFAITIVTSLLTHSHAGALHKLALNLPLENLMLAARNALDYFSTRVDSFVVKIKEWTSATGVYDYFKLKADQLMFAFLGRDALRRLACLAVTTFDKFDQEHVHYGVALYQTTAGNWRYLPNERGVWSDGYSSEVDPDLQIVHLVDKSHCALPVGTQVRLKLKEGMEARGEVVGKPSWKAQYAKDAAFSVTLEQNAEHEILCTLNCCSRQCDPSLPALPERPSYSM
eukprot:TRINITY_DN7951_c0_g2_i1.p1 TRINITY_DN7951_c0_g2~~TRINITY_DN7951_c0_g2_i1.p1  ORF type:complete len:449 (-),score=22.11 TRINITY_DN7951_c0_g2_i1:130-1476(-)